MDRSDHDAAAAVARWLDHVVIGESFCPFAAAPRRAQRVQITTCSAPTLAGFVEAFSSSIAALRTDAGVETTLLVLTELGRDYHAYLDVLEAGEELLEHLDEEGDFTLAPFHPHFEFGGVPAGDPTHWIHQSPYPLVHILRTSSLEEATGLDADTSAITARNSKRAAQLGAAFFAQYKSKIG